MSQSKGLLGSATIKRNDRECFNQKECQGVLQSKGLTGSVTLKRLGRECHNQRIARECHNQKNYQGVLQGLPGSVSIKRTARK